MYRIVVVPIQWYHMMVQRHYVDSLLHDVLQGPTPLLQFSLQSSFHTKHWRSLHNEGSQGGDMY